MKHVQHVYPYMLALQHIFATIHNDCSDRFSNTEWVTGAQKHGDYT